MIIAWGETLSFADATRIWFVSNLVRYAPGSTVWQIGAMARARANGGDLGHAAAAGASAIINTVVNIATGVVVALIAGYDARDATVGRPRDTQRRDCRSS